MFTNLKILKTLGRGACCKVKLAVDTITGHKVALKIFREHADEKLLHQEVAILNQLQHKNIIRVFDFGKYTHTKTNGKKKTFSYVVLEPALGGELFDHVALTGCYDEPLLRYFFLQILDGLEACHRQGITHRDLKPENLLFDSEYNLKIADFGFAT